MLAPTERITRSYRANALWFAMDGRPKKPLGSSPYPSRESGSLAKLPYGFERLSLRTAQGMANILFTAKMAQQTTDQLQSASNPETARKQIEQLVDNLNAFGTSLDQAEGWLNPSIFSRIQSELPMEKLEKLGIHVKENGELALDEAELNNVLNEHFEDVQESLTGEDGFAAALKRSVGQLQSMPADTLLNRRSTSFRTMTNYSAAGKYGYNYGPGNPAYRSYWPMPIKGYLLNEYF
ncbi:flagellar filament capping protein FliD [Paenibacillus cremeus]|uniref:Flagellar hook-associated protein 2 C-terminal domain-containing protein n=1 Tax=Paenibacillus cremeus TaxID=2163881 RepID=A0A559K070_9BACL|nr:flagellar filament capping protein FliD [Paenibacillus cremeus]TVY05552.1 hypothetical protein FPZ49_29655 [Paenibacillus cremeus]